MNLKPLQSKYQLILEGEEEVWDSLEDDTKFEQEAEDVIPLIQKFKDLYTRSIQTIKVRGQSGRPTTEIVLSSTGAAAITELVLSPEWEQVGRLKRTAEKYSDFDGDQSRVMFLVKTWGTALCYIPIDFDQWQQYINWWWPEHVKNNWAIRNANGFDTLAPD